VDVFAEPVSRAEPVSETDTGEASGPELAAKLCFHVPDDVESALPGFTDTFRIAAKRWNGWELETGSHCASMVTIAEIGEARNGEPGAARAISDGLSAAYETGSTLLVLDVTHVENRKIVNTDVDACRNGAEIYLLSHILTHEIGHVLDVRHVSEAESVMHDASKYCADPKPTESELAAALRPSA
jgi:hypothetical protein